MGQRKYDDLSRDFDFLFEHEKIKKTSEWQKNCY
jgi:hypothetical protein